MQSRFLPFAALATAVTIFGCSEATTGLRPTRGYILISIDTLRADHLSCYGYAKPTSPFLDSLAERGALFERVVAPYPSTLTSHMSMFTGLYPPEHGIYPPDSVLSPEIPTLPGIFRRAGFRTAGYTESGFMKGRYGFARGFEQFDDQAKHDPKDVENTLAKGLSFLRDLAPEDSYFLFLHTYAVHTPYDPPEPYRSQYWPGEVPEVFEPTGQNHVEFNSRRGELSREALAYHEALYDAGIRYLDSTLESFFGELEALGLAEDLTVVITSDHGEEFLEHGLLAHSQIYYETLHVPLILVHPDVDGPTRVETLARTVDIAPTLLAIAEIESEEPMSGSSLATQVTRGDVGSLGRAHAEDKGGRDRALVEQRHGRLMQLVLKEIPLGGGDHWLERMLSFDIEAAPFELRIRSYLEPRRLQVLVDQQLIWTANLGENWTTIRIDQGSGRGKRRVDLVADSCTPVRRPRQKTYKDCFAFAIESPQKLWKVELFDLLDDPLGTRDLSSAQPDETRTMLTRLRGSDWSLVATPSQEELDPELENRLRALGYL